ncbi:MAG: ubiquitin-conjugating enzyme E2 [Chitinophagales bacterium]
MNARMRRLKADYERIQNEFSLHPHIKAEPIDGKPPCRYLVTYYLKGLRWDKRIQRPVETDFHQAEIYLHLEYPRLKPQCIMKTEIFHPNFGDWICVGDYWAAGETLASIIIQIGQMIQYQIYNPRSPVNPQAAKWARENENLLPIGLINLYQPQPEDEGTRHALHKNGNPIDIELDDTLSTTDNDDLDIDLL